VTTHTGHTYTTTPGATLLFPTLTTPTGHIQATSAPPPNPHRGLNMPQRKRTRTQDRAYRIALERQHTAARIADKELLRAQHLARNDEPPPF